MEVALKRPHKLVRFLNHNRQLWGCQQSKQSITPSQTHSKHFQIFPRNVLALRSMWENDQQQQQSRSYASNKSRKIDATKIPRKWYVARDESPTDGKQIKVVSYNILAQDLLVGHLGLYTGCNPVHLRWSYRLPRLIQEIKSHNPHILCMQEVQDTHLDDIALNLKSHLPMDLVYKKKTGFGNDGCAIFFNRNVFDLIESDAVEYYQPNCDRLDRHNIAVIAKLRCKSNPDYVLLVCTTHLLYNPRREDVRLAQLMVLLAELDRHVIRFEEKSGAMRKLPLILTGDFNFPPNSAPFELLAGGSLSYDKLSKYTLTKTDGPPTGTMLIPRSLGITDNCQHIDCVESNYKCIKPRIRTMKKITDSPDRKQTEVASSDKFSTGTLTHSFNLTSIFNHIANPEDYGSTYHTEWINVDHFFYSDGLGPNSTIELLASYELPTVAQCQNIPPLPNAEVSSDHLLLAAKINLVFSDKIKPV